MPPRNSRGASRPKRPAAGVLDAGLRLVASRAHSCAELQRKLSRRGYREEEIAAAMTRLTELGYLDDASFAAGHVRRRSATRGPLALSAELAQRGVDKHTAAAALSGFDRQAQLAAATAMAGRLAGHRPPAGYRELLDSVGVKLLRRGFSITVAQEACRAVWRGTEESA